MAVTQVPYATATRPILKGQAAPVLPLISPFAIEKTLKQWLSKIHRENLPLKDDSSVHLVGGRRQHIK